MIFLDQHCHDREDECHLAADSPEELREFARQLHLPFSRLEYRGTRDEHFDVSLSERQQALQAGAVSMDNRELRARVKGRTTEQYLGVPSEHRHLWKPAAYRPQEPLEWKVCVGCQARQFERRT